MGEGDDEPGFIRLEFAELPPEEMLSRAQDFHEQMAGRRTTRHFSTREVPRELIELAVLTASTAPSGAHLQPWTFVAVSNPELKARLTTPRCQTCSERASTRSPSSSIEISRHRSRRPD